MWIKTIVNSTRLFLHHRAAPERFYCQPQHCDGSCKCSAVRAAFLTSPELHLRRNKTLVHVEREVTAHTGAQYRAVRSWWGRMGTHSSKKPHHASAALRGCCPTAKDHAWGRPRARTSSVMRFVTSPVTITHSDAIPVFAKLKRLLLLFVSWHLNSFYFMKIRTKREATGEVSLRICTILLV